MSRFDHRDPGQDVDYCEGLEADMAAHDCDRCKFPCDCGAYEDCELCSECEADYYNDPDYIDAVLGDDESDDFDGFDTDDYWLYDEEDE